MSAADASGVRIDVWLWAARFFKTRALAKQAIDGGKVELNEQPCKPSRTLRTGDRLLLSRLDERFDIEVLAVSARRGPAAQAQLLYREDPAAMAERLAQREQRRLANAGFQPPAGKPDKRARRLIQALGDIDAM